MLPATTDPIQTEERRQVTQVLVAISTERDVSGNRVSELGIELSPGLLQTIMAFARFRLADFNGIKRVVTVTLLELPLIWQQI